MLKRLRTVALLGLTVALSGCWNFFGGGWAWSEMDPTKRVNIGVEGTCTDVEGFAFVELDLTFHDRGFTGPGVYNQNINGKKHMVINARNPELIGVEGTCEDADMFDGFLDESAITGQFFQYCPQGVSEGPDCGEALIFVGDTGDTGPAKGDAFQLALVGGPYDGYFYFGELQGGNFTVEAVID